MHKMQDVKWEIIADDFTGALDTGVQFVRAGMSVMFVIQPAQPVQPAQEEADVRVLSTESRNVDEATAAARVHAAVAEHSGRTIFKKIDSTMRGHTGAEIEAVLAARSVQHAVVCPAAPDAGRTVEHGRLLVGGIALHETAFADDPHWPARTSMVAELLRRPCTDLEHVTTQAIVHSPTAIVSVDARTNEDLAAIVHAAHAAGALPCGSLGLARVWANLFAQNAAPHTQPPKLARPILIVAGSRHPNTHVQIERLITAGATAFTPHDEISTMRSALAADCTVILRAADEYVDGGVTQELAEVAERLLRMNQPGTLVLTGGETAAVVCTRLAVAAVRIGGEITVGVPWGTIVGGAADGVRIVTKAGGFGDAEVLRSFA